MNTRRVVFLTLAAVVLLSVVTTAVVLLLRGTHNENCSAAVPPVDPAATEAAVCVAATLDQWRSAELMGVGQQLDVQESERMRQPLDALGSLRTAVVGFDFDELLNAQAYFDNDPVPFLSDVAHSGQLLTATWHAANPATGGRFNDRSWTNLPELLEASSAPAKTFWAQYDRVLAQAQRFQEEGVAVIFKPLHEASGSWFWWGAPDPTTYKQLFAQLQQRAYDRGVHNLLWAYAANPQRYDTDGDPLALLPDSVDLVGLDVYDDPEAEQLTVASYSELANVAPRMALTEVGPRDSTTGEWDPSIIVDTLKANDLYASYAMLWRDEPAPGNKYQIASLTNGLAWLASCPDGLCSLAQ